MMYSHVEHGASTIEDEDVMVWRMSLSSSMVVPFVKIIRKRKEQRNIDKAV